MPTEPKIPFLHGQNTKRGIVYHWKPSKRLRELGWSNLCLGCDYEEAARLAVARNVEVGRLPGKSGVPPREIAPAKRNYRNIEGRAATLQKVIARLQARKRKVEQMIAAARARLDDLRARRTWVYFIGAEHGPIKIGLSNDPAARCRSLQTGHPHKLRVMATIEGGLRLESAYHERFDELRVEGEWFARCGEILAEIRRLRNKKPSRRSVHERLRTHGSTHMRRAPKLDPQKSAIT